MKIFVSKPNSVTTGQEAFCNSLVQELRHRGFEPRTVGDTVLTYRAPLLKVKEEINACDGCIVLGLRQLHILQAKLKEGTVDESDVVDTWGCTPWNHMEAVLAYALDRPMLLIRERGVQAIGVLQTGVLPDYLVLEPPALDPAWLRDRLFVEPFNDWIKDVQQSAPPGH